MYCILYKLAAEFFETSFPHTLATTISSALISMAQPQNAHYRTMLNNAAQRYGHSVEYSDSQTGPLNNPQWTSVVYVNRIEYGRGIGRSRGSARERAAWQALVALGIIQAQA
ncbi:hypothetical protein B0H13DRAFT_1982058 [Mycena leptocephala]|nr:hypothetical protein B0H13DRAFT_1982058 [Mycena leptocephala]